jgi:hypothetical protein
MILVGLEGVVEVPPEGERDIARWVRNGYVRDLGGGMFEVTNLGRLYFVAAKRAQERAQ